MMMFKNVSKTIQDIRRGKKSADPKPGGLPDKPLVSLKLVKKAAQPKPEITETDPASKYVWAIKTAFVLIFIGLNFYAFNLWNLKTLASGKIAVIYEELKRGQKALKNFDSPAAEAALFNADQEFTRLNQKSRNYGLAVLARIGGVFFPPLGELPAAINNFSELNQAGLAVAQNLNFLAKNGLSLAFNGKGGQIISALENFQQQLDQITILSQRMKNQSGQLREISPKIASLISAFDENYLSAAVELYKSREWLAALLSILKSPEDRHFLLIFQNPSEIRPAGGFIGSHADFALNKASVKYLAVDDIYNADRQMDLKVVPPKQLQSLTAKWGARDANWFFDFPTSARKVIYFLENSDLYKNRGIRFFGAAAINIDVLESLLKITGPIELPEYRLTLTPENFLREVQYEVEAGRDKKPGQNPKKILSTVAPLLLEKLNNLSDGQKTELLKTLRYHLENKDLMVYFKDLELQDFSVEAGIAGESLPLPGNYSGDYLAVVNANVAGGKTDAFIRQKIILTSELQGDGSVENQLAIERAHSGQNEKDWWYKTENKNFIKILVPPDSVFQSVRNNDSRTVQPPISYAGFRTDPDIYDMENSGQEMGKDYFASWFNLKPGAKKTLELKYTLPRQAIIQNNAPYQFIFEKQSGVNGPLEYYVTAPYGYVWKETQTDIFRFQTENPKAREMINLTLVRI